MAQAGLRDRAALARLLLLLLLLRHGQAVDLLHVLVGHLAGDLRSLAVALLQFAVHGQLGPLVVEVRFELIELGQHPRGALQRLGRPRWRGALLRARQEEQRHPQPQHPAAHGPLHAR